MLIKMFSSRSFGNLYSITGSAPVYTAYETKLAFIVIHSIIVLIFLIIGY